MLSHCVTPANRARYMHQLEDMFHQRHDFFVDKKGWGELRHEDGRDCDDYDTDETVYLLVIGDMGEVLASARLNPTWGRHQLEQGSPLNTTYANRPVPHGPKVWECSRMLGGDSRRGREHAIQTFAQLMIAIGEFCRRRSVLDIVSVLETSAITHFQTAGFRCEPLGLPVRYQTERGPSDAMATIIRIGGPGSSRMRRQLDQPSPIFFEAASLRSEAEPAPPPFALLESASEIRTESGRRVAMEAIHAILMQEAAMNDNISIERMKA